MKKLVGALALVFVLASCTQVKIAHVDVEEILKEYKGSKKAEEEMKAQSEQMANELDQLAIPFQQRSRSISRILRTCRPAQGRKRSRS